MKYTLVIDGDDVELWRLGIRLDDDEARRVLREAGERVGVVEGIPLQDPPATMDLYRPYV